MLQVVEGSDEAVDVTLAEIAEDRRLWGMDVLMDVSADERVLRWTLGLVVVPMGVEAPAVRKLREALPVRSGYRARGLVGCSGGYDP